MLVSTAILLIGLLVSAIIVLTSPGLQDLRYRESLDMAQVARNYARGEGFTTGVGRPLQLRQSPGTGWPLPDLTNPPLFPLALSVLLRVAEDTDKTVAVTSSLFWGLLLAVLLVWGAKAQGVFTSSLAALMVTVNMRMAIAASAGHSITLAALFTFLALAVLASGERLGPGHGILSGALVGISFLAVYGTGTFLLALLCYVLFLSKTKKSGLVALSLVAGFFASTTPWLLRNLIVTGRPWGTLRWIDMAAFTESHLGLQVIRDFAPEPFSLSNFVATHLVPVLSRGLRFLLDFSEDLPACWSWIVLALVAASLLEDRLPESIKRLRSLTLLSLCIYVPLASFLARSTDGLLILLPPAALIGSSLLTTYYKTDRTGEGRQHLGQKRGAVLILCALSVVLIALPLYRTVFATKLPFPPLVEGDFALLEETIEEDAVVVTDVPFALTWHCDRKSVWLPLGMDQLAILCEGRDEIRYLYLSSSILMYPGTERPDTWKKAYFQKSLVPGFELDPRFTGFGVLYRKAEMEEEPAPMSPDGG